MAETVGFGKLERHMLSNSRLPSGVHVALIKLKRQIKTGRALAPFQDREEKLFGFEGQSYYESQVGQARFGDGIRCPGKSGCVGGRIPLRRRNVITLLGRARGGGITTLYISGLDTSQGYWA